VAWRLGRALFDRERADVAAALVASMVAVHQSVADPKVDWALALTTSSAVLAFVLARERPALHWLGWALAGLAVLSKGPLGLCLIAAAVVPEAVRRDWFAGLSWPKALLRAQVLPGLGVVALICAPFYRAVYERDGARGLAFLLAGQGFGKLVGKSGISNASSPAFFLHTALWVFLPATVLLLPALWVKARDLLRERALPPRPARLAMWWLVLPVLAFSISEYKLPQYIYPLAVPVALLCAELLGRLDDAPARRARGALVVLAVLGAIGSAAVMGVVFPIGWPGAVTMSVLGLLLVAPGLRVSGVAGVAVASMLTLELTYQLHFLPRVNEYQLGRAARELVEREDRDGVVMPVLVDEMPPPSLGLYTRRWELGVNVPRLAQFVRTGQTRVALVPEWNRPDFAAAGLRVEKLGRFADYPVTQPRWRFLNPATRGAAVRWFELVRVTPVIPSPQGEGGRRPGEGARP
jgi:4-amino-4-deoxy-L-arabinose transferase-like glycosyltransferase